MFFVKLPQNRHPERSASQIYRVIQRLWRGVEGPRRCLSHPGCSELFNHRARAGRVCHGLSQGPESQELASILLLKGWRRAKKLNLIRTMNPEFNDLAQSWGWKMITVHEK